MFSQRGKKEDFADNIWEVREGGTSCRIGEVLYPEGNTDRFKERAGLAKCDMWPSTMPSHGPCLLVFMPLIVDWMVTCF